MRTRYKPWIKDALKEFASSILVEEPTKYKGQWSAFFGNANPFYVELGMGKGKFLMTFADKYPDRNFIGFEVQAGVIYYPTKKIAEKGYSNIALINADVRGLADIFAEGEVSEIYINFCDPWPKKRHSKRRLTHKNFLELYKCILNSNGRIKFKTDNQDLFTFSLEEFKENNLEIYHVTRDLHNEVKGFGEIPLTEYEEKFIQMGIPICYCEAGIPRKL